MSNWVPFFSPPLQIFTAKNHHAKQDSAVGFESNEGVTAVGDGKTIPTSTAVEFAIYVRRLTL